MDVAIRYLVLRLGGPVDFLVRVDAVVWQSNPFKVSQFNRIHLFYFYSLDLHSDMTNITFGQLCLRLYCWLKSAFKQLLNRN